MSITALDHVGTTEDEQAISVPGFLLRGPIHRHEPGLVQFETTRPSVVGGALLTGAGVTAAVLAAAIGAYLFLTHEPTKRSADAKHEELSARFAQHEPDTAEPTSKESDTVQSPAEAAKEQSVAASARGSGVDGPRLVRTERFGGDPSVWASVRKFSPLPPDQVPVLDLAPPEQPPTAAPAALPKPHGAPHRKQARTPRHRHGGGPVHAQVRQSRTQGSGGPPEDVGGTRMTSAELRQDGSKNPVVNAISAVFGPH
jgi:hypothetical protein